MPLFNSRRSKTFGAILAITAGASSAYAAPPFDDDSQEQDKVTVDELADEWSSAGNDKATEEDKILPADENDSGELVVDDTDSVVQTDGNDEQEQDDSIFLTTEDEEGVDQKEEIVQDTSVDSSQEDSNDFLLEEAVDDPEQVLNTEQGSSADNSPEDIESDFTMKQETDANEDEQLEAIQEKQAQADSTDIVSEEEPLEEFEQDADAEMDDPTAALQNVTEDAAEESELIEEQPWDKPEDDEQEALLLEEEKEDEEEEEEEEEEETEVPDANETTLTSETEEEQLGIATVLPETIMDDVEKAQKELGISGEVQQDKHHTDEVSLSEDSADIQVDIGEWDSPDPNAALPEDGAKEGLDSVLSDDATEEPTVQYAPTEDEFTDTVQTEEEQEIDESNPETETQVNEIEPAEMEKPSANGSQEVEAELEAINDTLDKALDAIEKEKPQLDSGLYAESAQEFGNAGLPSGFLPADKYKEDSADMTLNLVIVIAVIILFVLRLPKIKRWIKSRSSNEELPYHAMSKRVRD